MFPIFLPQVIKCNYYTNSTRVVKNFKPLFLVNFTTFYFTKKNSVSKNK